MQHLVYAKEDGALNHANRAKCLACHQGGGPIFPAPPWTETNSNFTNPHPTVARYLKEELNGNYYEGFPIDSAAPGSGGDILGIKNRISSSIGFDTAVRRGQQNLESVLIWNELCKTNSRDPASCRGEILKSVLISLFTTADLTNFGFYRNVFNVNPPYGGDMTESCG